MNNIDIQHGSPSGYDVLINGDHHERCATHADAIASARAAAGDAPRYDVRIRDLTTPGDQRTGGNVPYTLVPRREPQA